VCFVVLSDWGSKGRECLILSRPLDEPNAYVVWWFFIQDSNRG